MAFRRRRHQPTINAVPTLAQVAEHPRTRQEFNDLLELAVRQSRILCSQLRLDELLVLQAFGQYDQAARLQLLQLAVWITTHGIDPGPENPLRTILIAWGVPDHYFVRGPIQPGHINLQGDQ